MGDEQKLWLKECSQNVKKHAYWLRKAMVSFGWESRENGDGSDHEI
jgi:hypothetical protein